MRIIAKAMEETNKRLTDTEVYSDTLNVTLVKLQVLELFESTENLLRAIDHRYQLMKTTDIVTPDEFTSQLANLKLSLVNEMIFETDKRECSYSILTINGILVLEFTSSCNHCLES